MTLMYIRDLIQRNSADLAEAVSIALTMVLSRQQRRRALIRLRGCTNWSAPLMFACKKSLALRSTILHQIIFFRMAEASTIGFTTDSVDGKSSTMHAASDQLIDPYC